MLAQATLNGGTIAERALEEFVLNYRDPVIALLRHRGLPEARIEDLTHDFLLQVMKSSALKRADQNIGPFRHFLCGMLKNFLANDAVRNGAAKRGGGAVPLSLDADDGVGDHVADDSSDFSLQLDREWALHLVARSLAAVRKRWLALEKPERFAVLRAFLPGSLESISRQDAALRLGISDEALRKELHRLREAFRAAIRDEVAATVGSSAEIADEMRHLVRILQMAPETGVFLSQSRPLS